MPRKKNPSLNFGNEFNFDEFDFDSASETDFASDSSGPDFESDDDFDYEIEPRVHWAPGVSGGGGAGGASGASGASGAGASGAGAADAAARAAAVNAAAASATAANNDAQAAIAHANAAAQASAANPTPATEAAASAANNAAATATQYSDEAQNASDAAVAAADIGDTAAAQAAAAAAAAAATAAATAAAAAALAAGDNVSTSDLQIMKGISEETTSRHQYGMQIFGLYNKYKVSLSPCDNLSHRLDQLERNYMDNPDVFSKCGLTKIKVLQGADQPNSVWTDDQKSKAFENENTVFWRVYKDLPSSDISGQKYFPPTEHDLEDALNHAREGNDMALFVLTSKGLWTLHTKASEFSGVDFASQLPDFEDAIGEYEHDRRENFRVNNTEEAIDWHSRLDSHEYLKYFHIVFYPDYEK